jgi:hypothetical protein
VISNSSIFVAAAIGNTGTADRKYVYIHKLTSAGQSDVTFGIADPVSKICCTGYRKNSYDSSSGSYSVTPQSLIVRSDGRMIVGSTLGSAAIGVMWLDSSGYPDTTQGVHNTGIATLTPGDSGDSLNDMGIQSDGKILLSVSRSTSSSGKIQAVYRLNALGTALDSSWGPANGTATIAIPAETSGTPSIGKMLILSDPADSVLVVGGTGQQFFAQRLRK